MTLSLVVVLFSILLDIALLMAHTTERRLQKWNVVLVHGFIMLNEVPALTEMTSHIKNGRTFLKVAFSLLWHMQLRYVSHLQHIKTCRAMAF